nr:hypothetical protein [Tanacetum cinerariifolium]
TCLVELLGQQPNTRGVCLLKLPSSSFCTCLFSEAAKQQLYGGVYLVKLPTAAASKGSVCLTAETRQQPRECLFGLGLAAGRITKI